MFAGAAYSDQADIKHPEAVDMLTALGIVNGYTDGSFQGEQVVNRGEMAKMVAMIVSGGNDVKTAYQGAPTNFQDLTADSSTAWSAPYVKYIEGLNIVAGKSATKFAPSDKVTGTEVAKMMLVALGYDPVKAGLQGHGWAQNTMALGNTAGLFDDVTNPINANCTRDDAAQILYNAINADTVALKDGEYQKKETSGLEWKENPNNKLDGQWVNVTKNETLGKKYMKLDTVEGLTVNKVEKEDGKSTYSINGGAYTKVDTDYSSLMGQKVKVLIKDNKTDKVYGLYADDDSKVVATASAGTLDKVTGDNKKVKLDGTEYKLEDTLASTEYVEFNTSTVKKLNDLITAKAANAANTVKLIDNDNNGKVDTIVVTPLTVAKVTFAGVSSITAGGKSYKFEDADIYEGVKKDDYAVILLGDYTVTGDPVITKAETLTGKVEGSKSGELKVDGTWYKIASTLTGSDIPDVGDSAEFAIVGNYLYSAKTTSASSKDVLMISANNKAKSDLDKTVTVEARAYFLDGTNKKITIEKINGLKLAGSGTLTAATPFVDENAIKDMLFTYSTNSDGNYELKELANADNTTAKVGDAKLKTNKAGYDSYSDNATAGAKKIATTSVADDAKIFVSASGEIKIVSGKTYKDWDFGNSGTLAAKGALINEKSGLDYVNVALITTTLADVPGASGDKLYGYLTADAYSGKDDKDDVTILSVFTGSGDSTTYNEKGTTNAALKAGTPIQYHMDGDRIVIDDYYGKGGSKWLAVAVKGFADSGKERETTLVALDGTVSSPNTDEDCVFIGVDDKNTEGTEGGIERVQTANQNAAEQYIVNAYAFVDTKVFALIFDTVENELDMEDKVAAAAVSIADITDIAASAPKGAYTFKINGNDGDSVKPGVNFTVEITCATKPASGTDTIKLTYNGVEKTVTFTDVGKDTVEFTAATGETTITASITNA